MITLLRSFCSFPFFSLSAKVDLETLSKPKMQYFHILTHILERVPKGNILENIEGVSVDWLCRFHFVWFLGFWFLGFKVSWFLGFKAPKFQIFKKPFHVLKGFHYQILISCFQDDIDPIFKIFKNYEDGYS